jgi:hypothetical protein
MRNVNTPTNHHQQEIQEFRFQHLADDPAGWADGVPWYRTTINRIKMMAAGVARIMPFLAASGTPTANTIGGSGSLGASSDAALADHAHANPGLATSGSSGFMSGTHVDNLATAYSHAGITGNPHGTTIGSISGLQTALDGKSPVGHGHAIGDVSGLTSALSGKADLDGGGKVPSSQLPSYVDDVVEYADRASFPATGESGKIYLALDDYHQWRWSGSQYIDMTSESGDQYNMGTSLQILGDPFSARSNYDGRGGVRTATGEGPFGPLWYNMVDVRHRNTWDAPGDIWGGELVWGMTGAQTRLAFRSRGGDGTPGAWTEVSTTSHTHSIQNITDRASGYADDDNDVGTSKFMRWRAYGDGFLIFDASGSAAPNGAGINRKDATNPWDEAYPTLMGWNGSVTHGVRVDSARTADSAVDGVKRKLFLIGDGSATVFTLTHSLATKDVRVTVRRNSAPYDMVEVSDELDGADPDNKVKLTFYGEVPTTNEYRVVVMG